jgi:hypothetical protein
MIRGVEGMRPAAVVGRVGATLSDDFFDGPVGGVGLIRIACTRLEGPDVLISLKGVALVKL